MTEKELIEAEMCGCVWATDMLEPYRRIRQDLRLALGRLDAMETKRVTEEKQGEKEKPT